MSDDDDGDAAPDFPVIAMSLLAYVFLSIPAAVIVAGAGSAQGDALALVEQIHAFDHLPQYPMGSDLHSHFPTCCADMS